MRGLTALLVGVVFLAASACGSEGGTAQPSPAELKPAQLKISIPVSKTGFAQSDLAVAQANGFFQEQKLEVTFQNLNSGVQSVQSVLAGDSDIGGASVEPVLSAAIRGGITIIGSYSDRLTVVMETSKTITAAAQLKGKKLGIQDVGAFREVMTRAVYEGAGLKTEDVEYVKVADTAYIGSLLEGKIDSAILQHEQSIEAENRSADMHVLADLFKVWPDWYYGTYFVKTEWLQSKRQVAVRFLTALTKAHRFMYRERAKTVEQVASVTGFSREVVDKAYERILVQDGAFPVNEGLEDRRFTFTVAKMKQIGLLEAGTPDLARTVDRGPIREAVQKLGGAMKGDPRWH